VKLVLNTLFFLIAVSGFNEEMDLRRFESAWTEAGYSDSLRIEVLSSAGFEEAALLLEAFLYTHEPSPEHFVRVWRRVASSETSAQLADLFHEHLTELEGVEWAAEELRVLREILYMLDDSLTMHKVEERVFAEYAGSEEAAEITGEIFYDLLYPVWNNDSAKVEVLGSFIENYGSYSDLWRSRAFRYQLSAVTGTVDSTRWTEYLNSWLESCPNDPVACLTGAAMYIERDSSWAEALELADRGLRCCENWHPVGLDSAEHAIEEPALVWNLFFRRSCALFGLGRNEEAEAVLAPLLDPQIYSLEDYHSAAPFYWLAGEIVLERNDTLEAAAFFIESATLGDVVNRWAGKSERMLTELALPEIEYMSWVRDLSRYEGPVFEDVTGLLGPDSLVSGSRVGWGDYDGDGYPDLLLGGSLYWNRRGSGFEEVTDSAGLSGNRGSGGIFGDLDMDGDLDIVTSGMPVQVFRNDGGTFTDVTYELQIFPTGYRVEGTGLLDWNADGWLDVYLASYEEPGTLGEGTPDRFYLGGPGGFHEVSDSLGMVPFREEALCGRGVSPCDFDRDGDVDIFVSNYRLQENFLWSNDSTGASNPALETGTAGRDKDGWWGHTIGSAWGDFDCDGDWDLFCANLAHPRYIAFSDRSELLRNDGEHFTNVRQTSGIRFEETHSNPLWGDFDNDGWLDLYITSIYPDRRSFLYLGSAEGTFTDVTFLSGTRVFNGWGAAAADFDMDGRLDLVVGSGSGPRLLRNVTENAGFWLLVEIEPPEGVNGSATGCTVEISDGERTWLRQVEGGSGTTSQNDGLLHFGLPGPGPYTWKLFLPGSGDAYTGSIPETCTRVSLP
jgi:hypothetical protein